MAISTIVDKPVLNTKYTNPLTPKDPAQGSRVNGKNFKVAKDAFRIKRLGVKTSYSVREQKRQEEKAIKQKLEELKQEKLNAQKQRIEELKRRKEIKEEKEREEKLAAKYHAKKVERLKRKEKRNRLLKERKSGN